MDSGLTELLENQASEIKRVQKMVTHWRSSDIGSTEYLRACQSLEALISAYTQLLSIASSGALQQLAH